MATTQLTDIFVGDYYASLEPVNSPEKTAVYESGIVTRSPVWTLSLPAAKAPPRSATGRISMLMKPRTSATMTRTTVAKSAKSLRTACVLASYTSTKVMA